MALLTRFVFTQLGFVSAGCTVFLPTDCPSAVLAAPVGVFLHTIFISSVDQIFFAVPIMIDLFLHVSSESGLCFGSVRCRSPGHCCMYVLCVFSTGCISLHAALSFFSPFGFVRCTSVLRMNSFCVLLYLYIFEALFLFGSCKRSASAGFFGEPSFFICASFTYLELLYFRYFFPYAVFISACFNLRYRSGLGLLL